MTNKISHLIFALLLSFLCYQHLFALETPQEKRLALVIGNSSYNVSPLNNPVNDANAIADLLTSADFKVLKYENLNQKEMKKAIAKFSRLLNQSDIGLFYFAGHGIQYQGNNYILPIDIEMQYESDIDIEAVNVARVLTKMESAKNKMNIVILDACRNNSFTRSFRSLNRGLTYVNAGSGTLISYATAPGQVAYDGMDKHSLYTSSLIKNMSKPNLKIEDVFKRTRIDVKDASQGLQIPWESSSLEGDFYFFKKSEFSRGNSDQEEIEKLFQQASLAMKQKNYVGVPPFDAVSLYQQILHIQPQNKQARRALKDLSMIFLDKAVQANKVNDYSDALLNISYGLTTNPNNKQLIALRRQINAQIQHNIIRKNNGQAISNQSSSSNEAHLENSSKTSDSTYKQTPPPFGGF